MTVVCGTRVFPSGLLEDLFTESIRHGLVSVTTPDGASSLLMGPEHPFRSIFDVRTFVRSHVEGRDVNIHYETDLAVAQVLTRTRAANVTNKHDAIYAVLGILGTVEQIPYGVQYTQPVEGIFTKWTASINWAKESLRLASFDGIPKSILNLPSWTPNWSCSPSRIPLARGDQGSPYNALRSSHKPAFRFNIPEKTLYAHGGFIDAIDQHDTGSWTPDNDENSEFEEDRALKELR